MHMVMSSGWLLPFVLYNGLVFVGMQKTCCALAYYVSASKALLRKIAHGVKAQACAKQDLLSHCTGARLSPAHVRHR